MEEFEKQEKQIDIKFEVLNEEFLKNFSTHGSMVLHLRPCQFLNNKKKNVMFIEQQ
jgi:hypothetical protein